MPPPPPPPPPPHLPTTPLQTLKTHTAPINTLTFSQLGGTFILTGSSDRQIHLSRTEPPSSSASSNKPKSTSTISPPSKTRITTSPIQKYTSHGYPILSIAVSAQNTHFASVGGDRAVFYWDIQTPDTTLRRFGLGTSAGHTARINCVAFGGDGGDDNVLVSGSDDKSVRIWDLRSRDPKPVAVWEEARDGVSSLIVRGCEVIAGSVDGRIRAYDLRMGRVVVDVSPGPVTSLDLSADGRCLLVGSLDGRIRLMDRERGGCLGVFPASEEQAGGYGNGSLRLQSCFGGGEGLVLSGSENDGKVRAWDVLSGKLARSVDVSESDKVVSVVKWREGNRTQGRQDLWAAGGADGMVRIYGESVA